MGKRRHAGLGACRSAFQRELVAASQDADVEGFFDLAQVLVECPAQVGKALVVGGVEVELDAAWLHWLLSGWRGARQAVCEPG
jgi:hypothetical protein